MVAKSSTFDNQFLLLIFNGTTITGLARNDASPLTNLFLSLHTATPAVGGVQTTNEAAYPGYTRATVARTSSGFTVSGSSVTLTADTSFPISTGSPSETETFWAVGTVLSGAGEILYFGAISPTILVNAAGVTPKLLAATSITEQ